MAERNEKYTIAECAELPSKGLVYEEKVNPLVELRSMTARDEMKRLAPSPSKFKVLSDIIEGCMVEKPAVHVYDMCLGDYQYLLHKLRIITYGPEYKMLVQCQSCEHVFEATTNLEQLAIKEFDQEKFNALQTFELPISRSVIKIKMQTPRLLDQIDSKVKTLQRQVKVQDIDFNTFATLMLCIESVDGEELEPMKLENFINRLPARDMQKILQNIDELSETVGLDQSLIVDCPNCHGEVKTFFRFGPEFFRPTTI